MEHFAKEGHLKKRLDHLENQLLALHATIVRRKVNPAALKQNLPDSKTEEAKHPVCQLKLVQSRYRKPSEKTFTCNKELFEYLENLTKHVASGSNAMQKLANLTNRLEKPNIRTIFLPRESFYDFVPELKTVDAHFAVELPPTFPLNKDFRRFTKISKQDTDKGSKPCQEINFHRVNNSNIHQQKRVSELESGKKLRDAQGCKHAPVVKKSFRGGESGDHPHMGCDEEIPDASEEVPTLNLNSANNSPAYQVKSKERDKASKEFTDVSIQLEKALLENEHMRKEIDILKTNQELNGRIILQYQEKAKLAEEALRQHEAQRTADDEIHSNTILEMKHSYDLLTSSKHELEKDLTLQIKELSANNRMKVRELAGRVYDLNKKLEKRDKQIVELTNENNDLIKKMEIKKEMEKAQCEDCESLKTENSALKSHVEEQEKTKKHLEGELMEAESKLKLAASSSADQEMKLRDNQITIANLESEILTFQDLIKIKDTMLDDQLDTIKSLKSKIEENKLKSAEQSEQNARYDNHVVLEEEVSDLQGRITELQASLREAERWRSAQRKNIDALEKVENKMFERQKEWEMQMSELHHDKREAVQTAKFVSKKLVQTVKDYELQVKLQKQTANFFEAALNEKHKKLEIANQQIEILNTQLWKSTQKTNQVKREMIMKLKKARELGSNHNSKEAMLDDIDGDSSK